MRECKCTEAFERRSLRVKSGGGSSDVVCVVLVSSSHRLSLLMNGSLTRTKNGREVGRGGLGTPSFF